MTVFKCGACGWRGDTNDVGWDLARAMRACGACGSTSLRVVARLPSGDVMAEDENMRAHEAAARAACGTPDGDVMGVDEEMRMGLAIEESSRGRDDSNPTLEATSADPSPRRGEERPPSAST